MSNDGKGLSIHAALALAPDGTPHGLLDLVTHTRLKPVDSKRTREKRPPWERESVRWSKTVDSVARRLNQASQVVHVMDREADGYLLYDEMMRAGRAFVIRICQNRRILDDEHEFLREARRRFSDRSKLDGRQLRRSQLLVDFVAGVRTIFLDRFSARRRSRSGAAVGIRTSAAEPRAGDSSRSRGRSRSPRQGFVALRATSEAENPRAMEER